MSYLFALEMYFATMLIPCTFWKYQPTGASLKNKRHLYESSKPNLGPNWDEVTLSEKIRKE